MSLDRTYSNLTIQTGAKLVLIVMDGLGDIAIRQHNYLTPLEAALTAAQRDGEVAFLLASRGFCPYSSPP